MTTTSDGERSLADTSLMPAYEGPAELGGAVGDLANPLLASYRHMLTLGTDDRSFSPLIPTTVQEQQQAPSPTSRESRVCIPLHSLHCTVIFLKFSDVSGFSYLSSFFRVCSLVFLNATLQ